ncbi:uncharacterized protein Z519_12742 [Cladophialophora bantiana CBS 173.52]|uniref:Uncharacterized protein n=1 Tax=Cladophialophora bantiana (strain ATCC 10958 / CBS 173.52 / CDC B-1940 / NIH 8579) TaxID=1442370 RepID=A0A0D2FJ03_CLAB1|nr:uncharacterized protein Z519_12742 [Cladophialophora bantiana CBS 173.52]KIW86687.1 hypothetical protein Z519_12742 [Cladophialophora bantiana CBS 173.52]
MGDQPSSILRLALQNANLNDLFTDLEFVGRFDEACKTHPFTKAAAAKLITAVFPKNKNRRRKVIESLSHCVTLPKSVKELCRELEKDPSSFCVAAGWSDVRFAVQHLQSLHKAQEYLTELVQYVAVIDSLCSLAFYWHGLECGGKATRYKQIAERIHNIETEGSDSEKQKDVLDTYYLHDIGTVFHLPSDVKSFILSLGLPREKFQKDHQTLAERLIDAGIQTEARSNGGRQILIAMQACIVGAWHSKVVQSQTIDSTASSQHSENSPGSTLATDATDISHIGGVGVDDILAAAAFIQGDESIGASMPIPDDQQNCSAGPLIERCDRSAAPGIISRQNQIAIESGETSSKGRAMDLNGAGGFGWNSGTNALDQVQPILDDIERTPKRPRWGHQINAMASRDPEGSDSAGYQGQYHLEDNVTAENNPTRNQTRPSRKRRRAPQVCDSTMNSRSIESESNDTHLATIATATDGPTQPTNYAQHLLETPGSSTTQSHVDPASHPSVAPHLIEIDLIQEDGSIPIHDTASTFMLRPPDPNEMQDSTMVAADRSGQWLNLDDMDMVRDWSNLDDMEMVRDWSNLDDMEMVRDWPNQGDLEMIQSLIAQPTPLVDHS